MISVFRSESLETETSDYSNEGEVQPETESAESVIAETKKFEQSEAFNEDPVAEERAQTSAPLKLKLLNPVIASTATKGTDKRAQIN
ncbi:hypothetical protein O9992_25415 [Vibrio lentus]|nr:hypothetical protein [Vibrio lentus]